jgi:beta-phosphoglucomutase-like phosphatase (HAD superfamily)
MSSIEDAIKRIEEAATKQRDLTVEESRAIRDAVAKASRDARDAVKEEYKERRVQVKKEVKEAEKAIKEAKSRIEKALGSESKTTSRAPRGSRATTLHKYFKDNPGSTVSDAAKSQGVSPNGLYPVARKLTEEGKLKKAGSKYTAV